MYIVSILNFFLSLLSGERWKSWTRNIYELRSAGASPATSRMSSPFSIEPNQAKQSPLEPKESVQQVLETPLKSPLESKVLVQSPAEEPKQSAFVEMLSPPALARTFSKPHPRSPRPDDGTSCAIIGSFLFLKQIRYL